MGCEGALDDDLLLTNCSQAFELGMFFSIPQHILRRVVQY